jgi:hypothetical protein
MSIADVTVMAKSFVCEEAWRKSMGQQEEFGNGCTTVQGEMKKNKSVVNNHIYGKTNDRPSK